MKTLKQIFDTVAEKRNTLLLNKRTLLDFNNKRDVWNSKRRFSY